MTTPVNPPPAESGSAVRKMDTDTKALIVVGVLIVVVIAPCWRRPSGGDDAAGDDVAAPTPSPALDATAETPPATEPAAPSATEVPASTDLPTTTAAPESSTTSTTSTTPTTSTTSTPEPDEADASQSNAEVEESTAVIRGGQIFLTGAVPTAEAGEEIEALAADDSRTRERVQRVRRRPRGR